MSQRVRDQALSLMECEIPAGQSIAEYRQARLAALTKGRAAAAATHAHN